MVEPILVNNISSHLYKLGMDCSPIQLIRELTQNSIEAIERKGYGEGRIEWDINPKFEKLCITDTGDGMDETQLRFNLNKFGESNNSSGKNFGIGAKIAGGVLNPEGMLYESWYAYGNPGISGLFRLDTETNTYGLEIQGDTGKSVWDIPKRGFTGTRVTLFGEKGKWEDTFLPPPSSGIAPYAWIQKALDLRYYTFPFGTEVYARDFTTGRRSRVYGQEYHLGRLTKSAGVVKLRGATAHWWLLNPDRKHKSGEHDITGHVACLYENELYERTSTNSSKVLARFGIRLGQRNVVIYIRMDSPNWVADTTRHHLVRNGERIPWDRLAEEFSSKMPEELRAYVAVCCQEHCDNISEQILQNRLEFFRDYPLYAHKSSADGTEEVAVSNFAQEDSDEPGVLKTRKPKPGRPRKEDSEIKKALLERTRRKLPEIVTDSEKDNESLLGQAAMYDRVLNRVTVNWDWTPLLDMLQVEFKKYPEEAHAEVEKVLRDLHNISFAESIAGLLELRRHSAWTEEQFELATSPEALSAVGMQRFSTVHLSRLSLKKWR